MQKYNACFRSSCGDAGKRFTDVNEYTIFIFTPNLQNKMSNASTLYFINQLCIVKLNQPDLTPSRLRL